MDLDRIDPESPVPMRFPLYTVAEPEKRVPMVLDLEGFGRSLAIFTDNDLCDQYMEDHEAGLIGMIVENRSDLRALCTMFMDSGVTWVAVDVSHRSPVSGNLTPLSEFLESIPVD